MRSSLIVAVLATIPVVAAHAGVGSDVLSMTRQQVEQQLIDNGFTKVADGTSITLTRADLGKRLLCVSPRVLQASEVTIEWFGPASAVTVTCKDGRFVLR